MNVFLRMVSEELDPDDHAVLIMDQAGWHKVRALAVPANITILLLPYFAGAQPGREPVGVLVEPLPVQPGVRRLRPPAGRRGRGLAGPRPSGSGLSGACTYITHEK
ncbi:MAG: hypothetical protein R3B68_14340 [Phycisphaerales bacterium]